MFDDDAVRVSAMLDLTLTGKDCGEEKRAPMCGIPYHAAEGYIAKLVSMGEKVAICEQLTPAKQGELVKRDVVRIVSAGTVINSEMIDDKSNNFILSICYKDKTFSISWADITTGDFLVKTINDENAVSKVVDLLVRINPAEIISDLYCYELFNKIPLVEHGVLPKFNLYTESEFDFYNAESTIKKHFKVANLSAFNLPNELVRPSTTSISLDKILTIPSSAPKLFKPLTTLLKIFTNFVPASTIAFTISELIKSYQNS
jgi:DNA mismatch repair protein MutS